MMLDQTRHRIGRSARHDGVTAEPPEFCAYRPRGNRRRARRSGRPPDEQHPVFNDRLLLDPAADRPEPGLLWLWQMLEHAPSDGGRRTELFRLAAVSADRPVRTETLNRLGRFAYEAGDPLSARAFFQEALLIGRETRDATSVGYSLSGLGSAAIGLGAWELARALFEECLAIRRRIGDVGAAARTLAILGWLARLGGQDSRAEALHEESLSLRCALAEPLAVAYSLLHLGWLAHVSGDRQTAAHHLAESLRTVWGGGEQWRVAGLLALLARPAAGEAPVVQAVRLLTCAEILSDAPVSRACEATDRVQHIAEVRTRLDGRAMVRAWVDGRDACVDALVEHALGATAPPQPRRSGSAELPGATDILTPRERETVVLVARGYTNRQIADELVISARTAEAHVRNIREKLGFAGRAQVAAWAASHGLLAPAPA
jgi:DNA-binding CsgD family transcriptional regulator/tetratricopeptide (TPR) repeat protein